MNCRFVRSLLYAAALTPTASSTRADFVVDDFGAPVVEDFDLFTGAGFEANPSAGQLDSDAWRVTGLSFPLEGEFAGSFSLADFAQGPSDGDANKGGVYAFDISNGGAVDRTLGIDTEDNGFNPGAITLRVENNTGAVVALWDVAYDVGVRNNGLASHSFDFSFSTDDLSYTDVPALDVTSPEAPDAEPSWSSIARFTQLAATVNPGGYLYLRWTGEIETGLATFDEFALNNVSVTAVPEPTALCYGGVAFLLALAAYRGFRSCAPSTTPFIEGEQA